MEIRDGDHLKFLLKACIGEIKKKDLDVLGNTAQIQMTQAGIQPVSRKTQDEIIVEHQSSPDKLETDKIVFETAYNLVREQASKLKYL